MQKLKRWCTMAALLLLLAIMALNWLILKLLKWMNELARGVQKRLDCWTESLLRKIDPSRTPPAHEVKVCAALVPPPVEPTRQSTTVLGQPIVFRENELPRRPTRRPTPPPQRPEENNPWGE